MPFIKTGDITTMIYEYNRGDRVVKVDPAIIWRKLNAACRNQGETFGKIMERWSETVVNLEDDPDEVNHKLDMFADLEPLIESVAREAFSIPPIDDDGNGGTVALVISTLNDFLSEREKKSENTEILPSSSPPMVGGQPDLSRECSASSV